MLQLSELPIWETQKCPYLMCRNINIKYDIFQGTNATLKKVPCGRILYPIQVSGYDDF